MLLERSLFPSCCAKQNFANFYQYFAYFEGRGNKGLCPCILVILNSENKSTKIWRDEEKNMKILFEISYHVFLKAWNLFNTFCGVAANM